MRSVMAPTGHVDTHWPQNSHGVSASGRSKGVVATAAKPRSAQSYTSAPWTSAQIRMQRPQLIGDGEVTAGMAQPDRRGDVQRPLATRAAPNPGAGLGQRAGGAVEQQQLYSLDGNTVFFSPVSPLVPQVCDLMCGHVTARIKSAYQSIK